MEYKEKKLEEAKMLYETANADQRYLLERLFPQLIEYEDEKIRKELIEMVRLSCTNGDDVDKKIDWLKKQREQKPLYYIRFGDIPSNETSKIYRGEVEVGNENGVSVYPAFEVNGDTVLGLTLPITKTTLYTQQHLLEYDNRPCYLVSGDYVGKGTDGEPLIKNVRIIKEIKPYRMKQDKENNTYVINNTPNCGISLFYNEELKESDDERIRKALLEMVHDTTGDELWVDYNIHKEEALAWIEKQKASYTCYEESELKRGLLFHLKELRDFKFPSNIRLPIKSKSTYFDWISWLEKKRCYDDNKKQGEQKPADKVKPKFHEGEWITNGDYTWQIVSITNLDYTLRSQDGKRVDDTMSSYMDEHFHSFTIQDAKNGDVLVAPPVRGSEHSEQIFIFKEIKDRDYVKNAVEYYCRCTDNEFSPNERGFMGQSDDYFIPATKEQRDLLFQKMKEAGYEWDANKKELKKTINEEQTKKNLQDNSFRRMFEQKSALSEEDNNCLSTIIAEFSKCAGKSVSKDEWMRCNDFLHSLRDRVKPKQEWSEEDEKIIRALLPICDEWATRHSYLPKEDNDIKEIKNWLKSIRPQQKREWSKEDENMLDKAIYMMEQLDMTESWDDVYNWLKSIKGRVGYEADCTTKQEWKQENTYDLTDFENAMMHIGGSFFGKNAGLDPNDTNLIKEQANILLGLVPNQEWSEEDELMLTSIIQTLKLTNGAAQMKIDWLKSIRPDKTNAAYE